MSTDKLSIDEASKNSNHAHHPYLSSGNVQVIVKIFKNNITLITYGIRLKILNNDDGCHLTQLNLVRVKVQYSTITPGRNKSY